MGKVSKVWACSSFSAEDRTIEGALKGFGEIWRQDCWRACGLSLIGTDQRHQSCHYYPLRLWSIWAHKLPGELKDGHHTTLILSLFLFLFFPFCGFGFFFF